MGRPLRYKVPISATGFRIPRGTQSKYQGLQGIQVACATFDPSANSGDRTIAAHNLGVFIPTKAIIIDAWIDVVTTFTSATDAATIALKVQSANDIVAALAISDSSNIWDAGIHGTKINNYALDGNSLTQIGMAAARSATHIKTTAERELVATVAVEALTAGKLNLYVAYLISD